VEEILPRPNVGAVMGDIDREVAHEGDAAIRTVRLQRGPLPEELPLHKSAEIEFLGARDGATLPIDPRGAAVGLLKGRKLDVWVQPARIHPRERGELFLIGRHRAPAEVVKCFPEQPFLPRRHALELHGAAREVGRCGIRRLQPAALHQSLDTDQQRVACKSGKQLIGRFAVANRTERQNLPNALPRVGQPVGETERIRSQFADSVRPRKRTGVQQEAASPSGGSFAYKHVTPILRDRARRRTMPLASGWVRAHSCPGDQDFCE
jgi:hypothetical protein